MRVVPPTGGEFRQRGTILLVLGIRIHPALQQQSKRDVVLSKHRTMEQGGVVCAGNFDASVQHGLEHSWMADRH
jgi:hypothetical protein